MINICLCMCIQKFKIKASNFLDEKKAMKNFNLLIAYK